MKLFQFNFMFMVLVGLMLAISGIMVAAANGNCILRILIFDFVYLLIFFRISDAPRRMKREHCPCKFAAANGLLDHPNFRRDCIQDGSFDTFIC